MMTYPDGFLADQNGLDDGGVAGVERGSIELECRQRRAAARRDRSGTEIKCAERYVQALVVSRIDRWRGGWRGIGACGRQRLNRNRHHSAELFAELNLPSAVHRLHSTSR